MEEKRYAVAIDGPSGAGKSTMARRIANDLGFVYVDTGAIYRTVGYYIHLCGIGPRDIHQITRLIDDVNITITYPEDGIQHMILNGQDITQEIRTPLMSDYASKISAFPVVRSFLLDMQRDMARRHNVVMDGRDIGTVVLPQADVKIFLTASSEVRAHRRFLELQERGETVTYEKVLADLQQRDTQDSSRAIAPLRAAKDAVTVDSTQLDLEQTVAAIRKIIREKLGL